MDKLQEKVEHLVLGLREELECPICFGTMDSTLRQCENGHGVCRTCAFKINKCPSCKQGLVLAIKQNTLLKKILERLPKPCPYTDKGCKTIVFDKSHQKLCKFRPADCKIGSCNWSGCVKDIMTHVQSCASGNFLSEVPDFNVEVKRWYSFNTLDSKEMFVPIVCQGQLFWKYFRRNGVSKSIHHNFYYLKTFEESCDYYMSISFEKGNLKFEQRCKATDIEKHSQNYSEKQSGLIISDLDMENFRLTPTANRFSFTLKLLKEDIL